MLDFAANTTLTILGISFLIFMHELGHFLAARLFNVRVETFSIGFGPRIAGWRRGETDYRISAIPLGGYVKMAGEYGDFDDDAVLDPGDLASKPIWQRFVIFSGGVVVNFLLAFLIFPIAFGAGVPFMSPTLGMIVPGGPAWQAGLLEGDEILEVNGSKAYGFNDVSLEVALSDPENTLLLVRRGDTVFEQKVEPEYTLDDRYDIGIRPERSAYLIVNAEDPDNPAAQAGLQNQDLLVSVNGMVIGEQQAGLRLTAERALRKAMRAGAPLDLVVDREGQSISATLAPVSQILDPDQRRLGALPLQTRVGALRGKAAHGAYPLKLDDVLLETGGTVLANEDDIRSALQAGLDAGGLDLSLRRNKEVLELHIAAADLKIFLAGEVALMSDNDTTRIQVTPGGPLEQAGIVTGDTLVSLDGIRLDGYQSLLTRVVTNNDDQVEFLVGYSHDGVEHSVSIRTQPLPVQDYGLFLGASEVVHEMNFGQAMVAGWDASINALRTTGLTLAKLITGEVGTKNLGGPISISYITYKQAEWDFSKLLFFLALLSVNLGFINILPIPVLDGGQIMFLLFEKVKGSRLSDRFMQNAQLVGFVGILALMAYVTYNDIVRFVG
jgi:regulator of sigma E protease